MKKDQSLEVLSFDKTEGSSGVVFFDDVECMRHKSQHQASAQKHCGYWSDHL